MLSCLRIHNFALIDQLELDLSAGLNVLTGETGAGKSIVLDALDVALGGRANVRMIRQGELKGVIEATFQGDNLLEWLQAQEIDLLEDGTVAIARELVINKGNLRSRSRINGVLVNLQLIKQLRDRLVEITAQGQTVELLIPSRQRELLDIYGGQELLQQRQLVEAAALKCQTIKQALEQRTKSEQSRLQRLDLLQYQIKELEAAELSDPEELELLAQERDRLSHVVELQQLSYQAYQALYQNDTNAPAAADLLAEVESLLIQMAEHDQELEAVLEIVRNALTQVLEAGHQLSNYGDGLEVDPERLAEIEERIRSLKQISRKYGPTLAEAIAYYQQLERELAELTDGEESLEKLEQEYQDSQDKLTKICKKLTKLRKTAAVKLEQQLIKELKPLAMEKVRFTCRLTPTAPNGTGAEQVQYYFSPNPGEEMQPLSVIASGGEMSRFLLALKACFSETLTGAGTLVFDEIDAGVSGKVAQAIAQKLHQLSQTQQVLCVTHQPLIAAMADVHFRVEKQVNKSKTTRTVVRVKTLDDRQTRRDELAQLTGGHAAEEAITFAESLLNQAAEGKMKRLVEVGSRREEEGERGNEEMG